MHQNELPELLSLTEQLCAMRMEAEGNVHELESRGYPYISAQKEDSSGSFFLRTSLSLLIFCSFLWLSHENRSILGVTPEVVQEVLSTHVVLQEEMGHQ